MRLVALALLVGCSSVDIDDESGPQDAVDLRLTEADVPALAQDQEIWWGPDVVVEPYSDKMFCLFGTYEGDDVGLARIQFWQNVFGHHLQLFGTTTNVLDVADGEVLDCTNGNEAMTSMEPLLIADSFNGEPIPEMQIPDGMAYKLRNGQRWVLQAHYVNTSPDPVRAQDPAVLDFVAESAVDTWVAPLVINHGQFEIPAQGTLNSSYACDYTEDYNLLYLLGHMHEWGSQMSIRVDDGNTETTVYEVDKWDVLYRDDPPVNAYGADNAFVLSAGSTMTVDCSWENDTDEPLGFPNEMCVAVAMAYPALTDTICSD